MGRNDRLGFVRLVARNVAILAGAITICALAIAAVFNLSPRPGAWLIRRVFHQNDRQITAELQKHTPPGVTTFANERYRHDDSEAVLDVYVPGSAIASGERLPTVVWTHGGAWVAGSKEEWAPYFMVLADRGYTVVGIGYTPGPASTYPTALHQLDDALAYLHANADRLHIDPDATVLAGDSAGAQISSQYATMVTSPEYAAQVGITPTLEPARLKGMILYC